MLIVYLYFCMRVHRQLRFATYILLRFMVVARLAAIVYTKTSRVNPNVHKQKCANITLQTANTWMRKRRRKIQTLNKMLMINMKSQAIWFIFHSRWIISMHKICIQHEASPQIVPLQFTAIFLFPQRWKNVINTKRSLEHIP